MTLETILNLLPCEIGGYALHITHFYLDDEEAYLWEIAYTDGKDKCMYYTTSQTLEEAAAQTIKYLINNGFGRKNCADCTNDKGCVTCVDGSMKETV